MVRWADVVDGGNEMVEGEVFRLWCAGGRPMHAGTAGIILCWRCMLMDAMAGDDFIPRNLGQTDL